MGYLDEGADFELAVRALLKISDSRAIQALAQRMIRTLPQHIDDRDNARNILPQDMGAAGGGG